MRLASCLVLSVLMVAINYGYAAMIGRVCSAEDIAGLGATCENPKICTNACANKCESGTECRQCCVLFTSQDDRTACRADCDSVWPQAPEWPEFP